MYWPWSARKFSELGRLTWLPDTTRYDSRSNCSNVVIISVVGQSLWWNGVSLGPVYSSLPSCHSIIDQTVFVVSVWCVTRDSAGEVWHIENTTVVQYFYYVMVLTITFATMSRSHRSMLILYLIKMRDCIHHTWFSVEHCCVVAKSVLFLRTLIVPRGTGVFTVSWT